MGRVRVRIHVEGTVQGVGFRPYVARLATSLDLGGMVRNDGSGVEICIEGDDATVEEFQRRLPCEKPEAACILRTRTMPEPPRGERAFTLDTHSARSGRSLPPDVAACPECLAELRDVGNRRFGYAFTHCSRCGPRFSIATGLPYDRPTSTMGPFQMCPDCGGEYLDPASRRFQASLNACPRCGPRVEFSYDGEPHSHGAAAVENAARTIESLGILALKDTGGFQLLCDARDGAAVHRLRRRKHGETRPFTVLFPGMDMLRRYCRVTDGEQKWLESPCAPVVLLEPRRRDLFPAELVGCSPAVGALLPHSPLGHLLLGRLGFPVAVTGGSSGSQPLAVGNEEARVSFEGVADAFLWHDREVARPVVDSVVRVVRERSMVLRRGRGLAPLPIRVRRRLPPLLALGAQRKASVAIGFDRQIIVSQEVGDLSEQRTASTFAQTIADFERLYHFTPRAVACDFDPESVSARYAEKQGLPVVRVQHQEAHLAACLLEHDPKGRILGVAWDGPGFAPDGTYWGGEFFELTGGEYRRVASLMPFSAPSREAADGVPLARALLRTAGVPESASLAGAETGGPLLNGVATTSVRLLMEGVAALIGIPRRQRFDGDAMLHLEAAARQSRDSRFYQVPLQGAGLLRLDWVPLLCCLCEDMQHEVSVPDLARRLHNSLARALAETVRSLGHRTVALSGDVFDDALLVELTLAQLSGRTRVLLPQELPPNDGAVSAGQVVRAAQQWR